MNARLKGFSEEVDLETEETQHYLVFETDGGKKFSLPVPVETTQALINELVGAQQAPETPHEDTTPEDEEEEQPEQRPETDFDTPPAPKQDPKAPMPRVRLRPPERRGFESRRPETERRTDTLDIEPVDIPDGATVFGGEPTPPPALEIHDTNTQQTRMTEEKVPAL